MSRLDYRIVTGIDSGECNGTVCHICVSKGLDRVTVGISEFKGHSLLLFIRQSDVGFQTGNNLCYSN